MAAVGLGEGDVVAVGAMGGSARAFFVHELLRCGYIVHLRVFTSNALVVSLLKRVQPGGAKKVTSKARQSRVPTKVGLALGGGGSYHRGVRDATWNMNRLRGRRAHLLPEICEQSIPRAGFEHWRSRDCFYTSCHQLQK